MCASITRGDLPRATRPCSHRGSPPPSTTRLRPCNSWGRGRGAGVLAGPNGTHAHSPPPASAPGALVQQSVGKRKGWAPIRTARKPPALEGRLPLRPLLAGTIAASTLRHSDRRAGGGLGPVAPILVPCVPASPSLCACAPCRGLEAKPIFFGWKQERGVAHSGGALARRACRLGTRG